MMIPKQKLPSLPSTESGFTLIECLVAIIIVSILMVAVAPAVVISTATRVQARRVELATQAAQFYMDGLRAGRIPPPPYGKVMKPDLTQNPSQINLLTTFPAPKGGALTPPTPATAGVTPTVENVYYKDANGYPYLYCVDLDREAGCTKGDYVVQGFRSFLPSSSDATQPDQSDKGQLGYMLGIRVYRADSMSINGDLKTTVDSTTRRSRKIATFTGGAGDRTMPLVETTTQIRTEQTTYESLKQRLGVKSDTPSSSPSP
ncbi:MAG TPA: hormogonium polysaccharide secretion pseudopilin HpsB [Stenomitos sp.]